MSYLLGGSWSRWSWEAIMWGRPSSFSPQLHKNMVQFELDLPGLPQISSFAALFIGEKLMSSGTCRPLIEIAELSNHSGSFSRLHRSKETPAGLARLTVLEGYHVRACKNDQGEMWSVQGHSISYHNQLELQQVWQASYHMHQNDSCTISRMWKWKEVGRR